MLNIFLQYLKNEKRYSAHTIKAYKSDIEQLIEKLKISEEQLISVTHKELRIWCSSMIGKGLTARSVNRKISSVSAFFTYLMRQGIVEQNPTDKVINPKNIKRLPFFYEEKQMKTMLDGEKEQLCTQCNEENGSNNYIAQRNHAIFEVFYGTGMRLSELIGLRIEDINFSRQSIKVLGKGSKERIVPLTPHLSKELEHYMSVYRQYFCPSPNNPLFLTLEGKTMSPSSVYRMVNKALKNQGISGRKSPHILRHTFATHLLNNGADLNSIKTLLGHASLSATQIYTHNDVKKLQRVYDKAHPHAE